MLTCQELQISRRIREAPPVVPTDRELLLRFAKDRQKDRQEEAFAELVDRHAALVLSICGKVLRDRHEAEDAFQATFLILAKRASRNRWSNSVAGWLCKVAYRTAVKAAVKRNHRQEVPMEDLAAPHVDPWRAITQREDLTALYDELARLPERYRVPLVLCFLEGKTNRQAAEELGCSDGVVKGLLARGKSHLRMRLALRGVALSTGLAAAAYATGACAMAADSSLLAMTSQACCSLMMQGDPSFISPNVGQLAHTGAISMKMTTISVMLILVLGVAGLLWAANEDTPQEERPSDFLLSEAGDGNALKPESSPAIATPIVLKALADDDAQDEKLSLELVADKKEVAPGDRLTFTLKLTNNGDKAVELDLAPKNNLNKTDNAIKAGELFHANSTAMGNGRTDPETAQKLRLFVGFPTVRLATPAEDTTLELAAGQSKSFTIGAIMLGADYGLLESVKGRRERATDPVLLFDQPGRHKNTAYGVQAPKGTLALWVKYDRDGVKGTSNAVAVRVKP